VSDSNIKNGFGLRTEYTSSLKASAATTTDSEVVYESAYYEGQHDLMKTKQVLQNSPVVRTLAVDHFIFRHVLTKDEVTQ